MQISGVTSRKTPNEVHELAIVASVTLKIVFRGRGCNKTLNFFFQKGKLVQPLSFAQ